MIFSTTGGFSYVDDTEFVREHKVLLGMLKPGGKMLCAHLTPFCFTESLYEFLHLRFARASKRWKGKLKIRVKEKEYIMYLRSATRIERLLKEVGEIQAKYPVLIMTPPYQTGYGPGSKILNLHRKIENILLRSGWAAKISDQVAFLVNSK